MSANAIWFEPKENRFYFDGCPVRVETLGRLVGNALVSGAGYIDFDSTPRVSFEVFDRSYKCAVSVNYVQKMLAFVGKNGWFWDCLDGVRDHEFDNTNPTPGIHWAEYKELIGQAREGFRLAADLREEARSRRSSPVQKRTLRGQAREFESEARQLRKAAVRRLMPGISGR